jgi:hypothetical protein
MRRRRYYDDCGLLGGSPLVFETILGPKAADFAACVMKLQLTRNN